jgi:hypothetical protein
LKREGWYSLREKAFPSWLNIEGSLSVIISFVSRIRFRVLKSLTSDGPSQAVIVRLVRCEKGDMDAPPQATKECVMAIG